MTSSSAMNSLAFGINCRLEFGTIRAHAVPSATQPFAEPEFRGQSNGSTGGAGGRAILFGQ